MSEPSHCPCGSGRAYLECCHSYHQGRPAPSPEATMRSRFAAFVLGLEDYLVKTANPDQGTPEAVVSLRETLSNTEWLGLKIVASSVVEDGAQGFVEFAAFYKIKGQSLIHQLHEKSRFMSQDGQWVYWDGQFLPVLSFGRNDPCWCGSGQKQKKCHG